MRTFRFIVSLIVALAAIVLLGSLATAKTEPAVSPQLQAVYPNYLLPGINQACPKNSQKLFMVSFSVPKGSEIVKAREFMLTLKSGDVLSEKAYRVNKRLVEYYLFPRSRKAQVTLSDMRRNLAYAKYSSHEYTVVLSKDCVEQFS